MENFFPRSNLDEPFPPEYQVLPMPSALMAAGQEGWVQGQEGFRG